MRVRMMCVALCWSVSAVASAQVHVICRERADEELARTLASLIAQPVVALNLADGMPLPPPEARSGEWVTLDREHATVSVYSAERRATLSRALDADVLQASPYAVALATAELLEWFETSSREHPDGNRPQLGLGVDVELQSQPGYDLTFVRPVLSGELAWGRQRPGGFWSLGARASLPGSRTLEVAPAATGGATVRLEALAADAAVQLTLGTGLGRLGRFALLAQLGAGVSYLELQARDAAGVRLGKDGQVSPLLAAGLGLRYSLVFGFALAARIEGQWAAAPALYAIAGEDVLEVGALRVGLSLGVLWESAR